jgi:hypothetical protein
MKNMVRLQTVQAAHVDFQVIKSDGTDMTGLALDAFTFEALDPDGAVVAAFTAPTVTEPISGLYHAVFASDAETPLFTVLSTGKRPYKLVISHSATGATKTIEHVPCVRRMPWENWLTVSGETRSLQTAMTDETPSRDMAAGYSPPGTRSITVTVRDQAAAVMAGVFVEVRSNDLSAWYFRGTTNAAGQVTLTLDDGNYKVLLRKPMVTFTVPESLVVDGDESVTFTGTELIPTVPAAGYQALYGEIESGTFTGVTGATFELSPVGINQVCQGRAVTLSPKRATTVNGQFSGLEGLKGGKYRLTGKVGTVVFYSNVITIDDNDTKNYGDYPIAVSL